MVKYAALLFLLLLATPVFAQSGQITLLTVSSTEEDAQIGGTANLYLEIRPGSGQIFMDTFPLTKLDTQSSTRYANQIACDYTDADCSRYDFFYTIRAGSSVVGGPSAGAPIAVLTAALLQGKELDESVAMTGTINSGGIIGPVAGEYQKAIAAHDAGFSRVLISQFSYPRVVNESLKEQLNRSREQNTSLNISSIYIPANLSELPIPVIRVGTLGEALHYFTGAPLPDAQPILTEDLSYTAIMHDVAVALCERRNEVYGAVGNYTDTNNFTVKRETAAEQEDWYSLASFCFAEAIQLRRVRYLVMTQPELRMEYAALVQQLNTLDASLDREFVTIAQLETAMIVAERIREAKRAVADLNLNDIDSAALAFATERANSALVWSAFFEMESETVDLDPEHLENACNAKLAEAEERINYIEIYLPTEYLLEARTQLGAAFEDADAGEYTMCIFRASKARADADLLSSTIAISQERIEELIEGKLSVVEALLADQESKGFFPILGYSYYRYASSLAPHDEYSALTFAEYALELSNLDMYFPKEKKFRFPTEHIYPIILFGSGVLMGFVLGVMVILGKKKPKRRKR